jgi:hypothetical protein
MLAKVTVILGYVSIIRLIYLIFPHLIGDKFFSYLQQRDQNVVNNTDEKKLLVFKYSHAYGSSLPTP